MVGEALTKEARDSLLARILELDRLLNPGPDEARPEKLERDRLKEAFYQAVGEYFDRLPRQVVSACPFTGEPLKRVIDPYGLDGLWWWKDLITSFDEPRPPDSFKVLLGALNLGDREPEEVEDEVIPGPEVPFVVPRLLELPGMVAVVGRLELSSGDNAYPIAYFSQEDIPARDLHQPWLRQEMWYENEDGAVVWAIRDDEWDFELEPYVASGQLMWIQPAGEGHEVLAHDSGLVCPYLDRPGERLPQSLEDGERVFLELPEGGVVNPFDEG